ncbi:MAG TPA: histidine kinase [Thermoanaerobaculia bacterium]|nr:histidine kinase [Thermoanaerobaculia bacterium]
MSSSPHEKLSARELVLIFAFWTFLATLSSVNRLLDPRGFGFRMMSPAGPIALEFIGAWIWAALTPPIFRLTSRVTLRRVPLLIVIGVVAAIGVYSAIDLLRPLFLPPSPRPRTPLARELIGFRFVNELLYYFAIVAAGYARVYFLRDREQAERSARLQAQLAEARLDALRMQINPHFLFNTMNAISALVERDPSGVRKMIARLSELLRRTIDSRATDEVPLRQELELLDRYIEIMEVRFQGRLRAERHIDDEALDALVPHFILQPLVENAIEHGNAGVLEIAARRDGNRLIVSVRDHGPGVGSAPAGVGLGNTRARLEELYRGAASFALREAEGGGAIAEIVMPYRTHG